MRLEFLVNFTAKQFVVLLALAYFTFSFLFFLTGAFPPHSVTVNGEPLDIENSLYFSFCTMSKGCIGQYTANGFSKWLVTLEVVAGLFLLGMFISKLVGARNSKMLEKVYEEQLKRRLTEYAHVWSTQRTELAKLSHHALEKNEGAIKELQVRLTQDVSDNFLTVISSSIHSTGLFIEKNYMLSFVDKKFDDHTLSKLLKNLKITTESLNKSFERLEKSGINWKNNFTRQKMINTKDYTGKLAEMAFKKLCPPLPENAIAYYSELETEIKEFEKKIT